MFRDLEITDDLFTIPPTAPRLTRQYACLDLLSLSNPVLSVGTEINLDEYIFRSIPDFDNSINNNLRLIKRCNSESKQTIKSPNIKRINTF